MPCRVVRLQNRSITSAGRFALAAMLNAQPTRKLDVQSLEENAQDHRDDPDAPPPSILAAPTLAFSLA